VPRGGALTEEAEAADREDRAQLRRLEARFETLLTRRKTLLAEVRRLSNEQKELYDRRQAPQIEVEKLHAEHGQLGRTLLELRKGRDRARAAVDEAMARRRELLLTFDRGERERPEQIRREIAELELRQQTKATSLKEENELIAHLRKRTADLKEAEGRVAVVAQHEKARKDADAAIAAARAEVDRISGEMVKARHERDAKMVAIRQRLEAAGALVAELRAKAKAREDVMREVVTVTRELDATDREGRELMARSRARRQEAVKTLREFSRPRGPPREEALASVADAHLAELMKRGKITL
jgi:uncharacterized coiled-coil DUF342 family protein